MITIDPPGDSCVPSTLITWTSSSSFGAEEAADSVRVTLLSPVEFERVRKSWFMSFDLILLAFVFFFYVNIHVCSSFENVSRTYHKKMVCREGETWSGIAVDFKQITLHKSNQLCTFM